tara:strand:- start:79 stop:318 length:240 start_codon:yes stop_codon:yes gene_type:complete
LKNFWPHRSKANGFSIQNLALKYRLKISKVSHGNATKQFLDNENSISKTNDINNLSRVNLSVKRTHWANRDFSEYKEAA